MQEYLDQYIKVLEEDRTRFIDKVGDAGGGQYVVHFHGIEVLKNRFHEKIFQFRKSINIKIKFTIFFLIPDVGQYVVNAKHIFTELAAATAESIVLERYGSKALRIFRVVREKLHIEESQLQNLVMIPAKEVKYLTYTLMEGK